MTNVSDPREFDARKERRSNPENPRGKGGDARPEAFDPHVQNEAAQKPAEVEDRPMVSEVKPEDYPAADRADGDVTGAARKRP